MSKDVEKEKPKKISNKQYEQELATLRDEIKNQKIPLGQKDPIVSITRRHIQDRAGERFVRKEAYIFQQQLSWF